MSKASAPPDFTPAPLAPPSYAQAVGGVPPSSPYTPNYVLQRGPAIVTTVVALGPRKTHMICPHCRAEIDTDVKTKPRTTAYLASIAICILGCFCGCCCIPFCMDGCMISEHNCPNCNRFLGTYTRSF